MAEIVNLRRARKTKTRKADAQAADANRQKFGETKQTKTLEKARLTTLTTKLDAHRLDDQT